MSIGQTHLTLSDGHSVFIARYIDWAITRPLLLLGTATIGVRSLGENKTAIYGAMGADLYMILTGFAGALSVDASRWVWYALGCVGFVAVLPLLFGALRKNAAEAGREARYVRLVIVLTLLWVQYPIVWLVGEERLRVLSPAGSTVWYTALDVLAKVAFGFLSLATVNALDPAVESPIPLVPSRRTTPVFDQR